MLQLKETWYRWKNKFCMAHIFTMITQDKIMIDKFTIYFKFWLKLEVFSVYLGKLPYSLETSTVNQNYIL